MTIYLAFSFLLGACLGSFVMVMADPSSNLWRRSKCDSCGQPLAWLQLIPVLSSWFLRFRCRHCNHHPSQGYGFIEAIIGLMFTLSTAAWPLGWPLIIIDAFILIGLHISVWDWHCRQIPIIDLVLLVFLTSLYAVTKGDLSVSPLITFGLLSALFMAWKLLGKPFPLANGDWVLFIIASGWLAPENLPLFLTLVGGLGVVTAIIYKRYYQTPYFPFAPAILMATWVCTC